VFLPACDAPIMVSTCLIASVGRLRSHQRTDLRIASLIDADDRQYARIPAREARKTKCPFILEGASNAAPTC
jgi:hypothetical protein